MGTFSSVSVIKDKWTSDFNDTLTSYANYVYDSVIKSKIRYVKPFNITTAIPTESTVELTKQITGCAKKFEITNRLDSLYLASMIDSVSNLANTRYSSFFINYGNLWSRKQHRREVEAKALKVTAVVVGIALVVALEVIAAKSGDARTFNRSASHTNFNHRSAIYGSSQNPNTMDPDKDYTTYKSGMTCFYMIYDRQTKKFCYIRKAEFNSDKTDNNTFNPARVSEQLDMLLGYKIKTVKES
jgi:hypothetical protein